MRQLVMVAGALLLASQAVAESSDPVLYRFDGGVLFDGRYGPIAAMQEAAREALERCGAPPAVVAGISVDGKFGAGTRRGLAALAKCPEFAGLSPAAQAGDMTEGFWRKLMSREPPSLDERARTLMLTFEATDYVSAEWNFCQSAPVYNPQAGNVVCYSNDPKSYITWGPNGATAGWGREVQAILGLIDKERPALLDAGFGGEASAVRRVLTLKNDETRSLEAFLCGIWIEPGRRKAWKDGFASLGQDAAVRTIYDRLYRSANFDGGKITSFQSAYTASGLAPTEIDYAFFKDRAAHMTIDGDAVRAAIAGIGTTRVPPSWVRRAIARQVRPPKQSIDRLGRDVAFYVDGLGIEELSSEERAAWQARGGLRASSFGLSDERRAPVFQSGPEIAAPAATGTLTAGELAACPAAVLNSREPR